MPKKIKWVVLFLSSMFMLFYKNLNINIFIQMLVVLLTTYIFGLLIDKNKETKKSKRYLIISITILVCELFLLKYNNLLEVPINYFIDLFGFDYNLNINFPNSILGLSYYSLMMIGYLSDVYMGETKAEKNIFKLALFMSYFPILISGPFIKYSKIKEELYEGNKFKYNNLCYGIVRILWGCFKLLIISQRLNLFINGVYENLGTETGIGVYSILAILFFPLQLYTNFSGSIDIIMGISKIIGINLPENFNSPFFSTSITELWRRWHITLGEWLRNYIFYPLLKSSGMQNLQKKFSKKGAEYRFREIYI